MRRRARVVARVAGGAIVVGAIVGAAIIGGAACRGHGAPTTGADTPEGAVRGALEAAIGGRDASALLLDEARCHALYASDDAPPSSSRGAASDEASCARSAALLGADLRRLPRGATFELGAARPGAGWGVVVPVTLHLAPAPPLPEAAGSWSAVRVDGRYYAAVKSSSTAAVLPPSASAPSPATR